MAVVKKYLAGAAAVLALGWFLAAPSVVEAAVVIKSPEKKILGLPAIACNPAQLSYIIDGGNVAAMCGGKATMVGHGWVNYVWPGAINSNYYYVSAKFGEDGTEKISVFPTITAPGYYEVWASYRGSENRSAAAPFYVYADNKTTYKVVVNQKELHAGALFSVKLGTFYFDAHALGQTPRTTGIVTCENEGAGTSESVDAVFFKYVKPAPPANVSASDAVRSFVINVRWTPVPGTGAKYYQIYRNTVNNPATAQLIAKVGMKASLYQDKPLDEGQTYYYWVKTVGALGKLSGFSNGDAGSTGLSPAQVTGLSAVAGTEAGEVDLAWSAAANTDSYEIFRGASEDSSLATLVTAVTTLNYQHAGVPAGTSYYFVRGVNAIATGAFSAPAMVVVP